MNKEQTSPMRVEGGIGMDNTLATQQRNRNETFEAWYHKNINIDETFDQVDGEYINSDLKTAELVWRAALASKQGNDSSALEAIGNSPDGYHEKSLREAQPAQLSSNPLQLEQEPYAYEIPTKDGTKLSYAIYFTKYNNPLPEGSIPLYAQQPDHFRGATKMVQVVNALEAQTGESAESIIEWLTDKGGLTQLMLSYFGGMSSQAQKEAESHEDTKRLDFVLEKTAFIETVRFDDTFNRYKLMSQNEDEDFFYLHDENKSFVSERGAIDAAMTFIPPTPEGGE